MNPLYLLPLRFWLHLAGALAIVAIVVGWSAHERRIGYEAGAAAVQAKWDKTRALEVAAAAKATAENQAETTRRIAAHEEIAHAAQLEAARARADADRAAAAAGSLRQQLAAYVAASRAGAEHPPAASGGPATADPVVVLADLFSRADARAGDLAAEADRRGGAGAACERSGDSLSAAPPGR